MTDQTTDWSGVLKALGQTAFEKSPEALPRIRATGCRRVANADIGARAALRKDPAIVGLDHGIEVELHRVGDPIDTFIPAEDGVQGLPGSGCLGQLGVGPIADDGGIGLDLPRANSATPLPARRPRRYALKLWLLARQYPSRKPSVMPAAVKGWK
jgi:hypothetical protein